MKSLWLGSAALGCLMLAACDSGENSILAERQQVRENPSANHSEVTVEDARAFLADAEAQLTENSEYVGRIAWINANFITYDTNWLLARAGSESTQLAVRLANETKRFEDLDLPEDLRRKMNILRSGITIPAPSREGAADELAEISTRLDTTYATGTYEINGESLDLVQLGNIMGTSRNPQELQTAWEGWRTVSPVMADDYARMVEVANEGARELGFANLTEMWLSNYDMPADEMEAEVERLWGQVEPLYKELHCYVRSQLNEEYGDAVQPATGPIRADLLGNMWAQQWSNVYDLVAPGEAGPSYDLTQILNEQGYTAHRMVETGEGFFSSLGFEPLPETFWERSLITQPQDRNVVCHASAWDLDNVDDIRIKMCTQVNAEDFQTVHHELGHNYYQRAYNQQDFLFRNGAHDGFHEAIGDFIGLSITPEYLRQLGLIDEVPSAEADTGLLLNQALDKIAFLPFGLMVDKWRWSVFRGDVAPADYNQAWWDLRTQYQGIVPPGPRPADAFDPGAKYHIPGNTPYLRYFLSFVMQFQFHKAACDMAGWEGPLHRCSIYDNEEVGRRFNAMLEMGASQPWPDALEAFTGTREMDGSAIIAYFQPLMTYLEDENEGQECGW
ncbi:M2 family metallopeptidase [Woodsholea maritima]|uniref:M2 family metallopeptidase n=1 Tax=Woodsholea maritima TaxID=240237 RepID=UPI00036AA1D1|nr:M2 family metallopeptidase [Woodsholea maritima]